MVIGVHFLYFIVGPMTATVACDNVAFLSSIRGSPDKAPKYQFHLTAVTFYSDYGTHIPKTFGFKSEVLNSKISGLFINDVTNFFRPFVIHMHIYIFILLNNLDPFLNDRDVIYRKLCIYMHD